MSGFLKKMSKNDISPLLSCPGGVNPETLDCFVAVGFSQRRVKQTSLLIGGISFSPFTEVPVPGMMANVIYHRGRGDFYSPNINGEDCTCAKVSASAGD
jgi:hypothetical protein